MVALIFWGDYQDYSGYEGLLGYILAKNCTIEKKAGGSRRVELKKKKEWCELLGYFCDLKSNLSSHSTKACDSFVSFLGALPLRIHTLAHNYSLSFSLPKVECPAWVVCRHQALWVAVARLQIFSWEGEDPLPDSWACDPPLLNKFKRREVERKICLV